MRNQLVLPYSSPLFERNALKAEGICNVHSEWRRGNLVVFKKIQEVEIEPPETQQVNDWVEVFLQKVRIRLRGSSNQQFSDPSLKGIISGDILPSVSRRDPRRSLADVWTSGNRIFKCSGRNILLKILQALAINSSPQENVSNYLSRCLSCDELILVNKATEQIENILKIEQNEYNIIGAI